MIMKITIFKCQNCGASELNQAHDACAYCNASIFTEEECERRDLRRDVLMNGIHEGEDFRHALFGDAKLLNCTFKDCRFYGADLTGAEVIGCRFIRCDLRAMQTPLARLLDCTYSDCQR